MQITHIKVRDFQALKHVDIAVERPLLFVAGPNEQGKSSLLDAIRMALFGASERVPLKKDWPALIRDGAAKGAQIEIVTDTGRATISLPSGAAKREGTPAVTEALASAFRPSWFSSLVSDERRAFLFPLLGIATDPAAIAERIIARGAKPGKLARLQPLFGKATWEAIAADAKQAATKAKGAWEEITGEKWGAAKAAGWVPTVPEKPAHGTAAAARQAAEDLQAQIDSLNQRIGATKAEILSLQQRSERLAALAELAEAIPRRRKALEAAQEARTAMEQTIAGVRQIVAGQPLGAECECPECGSILLLEGKTLRALPVGGAQHSPDEIAEARDALAKYETSLITCQKAEANAKRDLDTALAAEQEREQLLGQAIEPVTAEDIEALQAQVIEVRGRATDSRLALEQFAAYDRAVAGAEKSRDDAAARHRDITEWLEIAELVGPSGVPGELLTEGMAAINTALAELARLAGWDVPVIRDDMQILIGTRPYRLGSESARYRADVLLALAITHLSGIRFLVLDGVEILVGPQRANLLRLLHTLAGSEYIDGVILAGTLKERPKLPGTYQVEWIEAGEVVAEAEAEKVAA